MEVTTGPQGHATVSLSPAPPRTCPGALSLLQDADTGGVEEILQVLGGYGVFHQLFLGKGGHWELSGPAPLPGGIGDMEAEERCPVEGHLVEALCCAIGVEAAAKVAAQVLGDCRDRERGQGHHTPTLGTVVLTSIKLGSEFTQPQPRTTQPTQSFASPRVDHSSDFSRGWDYFPSLISTQHSSGFTEWEVLGTELLVALAAGAGHRDRDIGSGGASHARDPAVTPGSPRVQKCGAGAKPVWG